MEVEVQERFSEYPEQIRPLILHLRDIVFSVAKDLDLGEVEETLKWGEPSYQVKGGSPVRMDWKEKHPDQYFLFFHCQTKLVDTFRELYPEALVFEGNRAIVLQANKKLPKKVIRHCLEMAMNYKSIRNLPLLGA